MSMTSIAATRGVADIWMTLKREVEEVRMRKMSQSQFLHWSEQAIRMLRDMPVRLGQVEDSIAKAVGKDHEACVALRQVVQDALQSLFWTPPTIPRGIRPRSHWATPEQRLLAASAIKRRLGFEPSADMVREFLNMNGEDGIRRMMLEKEREGLTADGETGSVPTQ